MIRELISRFTFSPFATLLGKRQIDKRGIMPCPIIFQKPIPQDLPHNLRSSWMGIRSFAEKSGIIVEEGGRDFAPKGEWISTFGVRSCRVLACQIPLKKTGEQRYLAHIRPFMAVSDFKPLFDPNKLLYGKKALFTVFNGPALVESHSRNSELDKRERSILRDPYFEQAIFNIEELQFLHFKVDYDDIKKDTMDVLFSPLGAVYILGYNSR